MFMKASSKVSNEEINLYTYLNHAIAENWVDTSIVQDYISSDSNYSDSNELYQGILRFLADYLKTDDCQCRK